MSTTLHLSTHAAPASFGQKYPHPRLVDFLPGVSVKDLTPKGHFDQIVSITHGVNRGFLEVLFEPNSWTNNKLFLVGV